MGFTAAFQFLVARSAVRGGVDAQRTVAMMSELLAPLADAFGGPGWWGILLLIPLLLAGHVSEVAVAYGVWRRSEHRPASRAWRVAAVSGAVAAVSLIATLAWVAAYAAPRLVAGF